MRSWNESELVAAVASSNNYCEAIRKLGLRPVGGNYKSVKKHIVRLGLDVSHFTKDAMLMPLRDQRNKTRKPDHLLFVKGSLEVHNQKLRRRVVELAFMPYRCSEPECLNPGFHLGKELVLHLDHKNGDHSDCRKENLRWLCPNCHSQTPTYARKTPRPTE